MVPPRQRQTCSRRTRLIVGDAVTDISGVSGGINIPFGGFFDGLVSFFFNFFTGAMEEQFSAGTKGLLEAQFKASFEAFTQTMEFPLPSFNPAAPPTVVQVASEFAEFEVTAAGIRVVTNLGG